MIPARDLPTDVRAALHRLATRSDRASPTVFVGRDEEFRLLRDATRGTHDEQPGHTVVINGVPGAGKTALLDEYATRLLAVDEGEAPPVVPVPLLPDDLNKPALAIIREVDRQFRKAEGLKAWGEVVNRMVGGASFAVDTLFAAFTKRNLGEFKPSASAPNSLPVALDEYVAFRLNRRGSTIVLLVDEAQNLSNTALVREHLSTLHSGVRGGVRVMAACFGLANTTNRFHDLGVSRLASGHERSIGTLSGDDAERAVAGTLESALAGFTFADNPFDAVQRSRWIGAATKTILSESANFPHHLANGCSALAEIALRSGIADLPPEAELRNACRNHKRAYYDKRLQPWEDHTTALAHAFASSRDGWTRMEDAVHVLSASDNFGMTVDPNTALSVFKDMCAHGFITRRGTDCRLSLPSLASRLAEMRQDEDSHSKAVQAIRDAASVGVERNAK